MERKDIAENLARFMYNFSYDKLPSEIIQRTKNLILDCIGSAIAGRSLSYSTIAVESVKGGKGSSTIFTYKHRVPATDAAFANSVLACGTAQDDVLFAFHPGTINVPTAIAVGEQEESSGPEIITSVVAGYDIMARMYLGGPNIRTGFRLGSVFGPFGAAAVAGKLLRLNEDQLKNTINLAANFASGLAQWGIDGTKERDFFDGLIARNGITAAILCKNGVVAGEASLDGERGFYQAFTGTSKGAHKALDELGKRFFILEARYKPYPVCGIQQMPIRLVQKLIKRDNINRNEIDEINVSLPAADFDFPGTDFAGPFITPMQAVLSTQFNVAAAFLEKPVASYRFYLDQYDDQEVFEFSRKAKVIRDPQRSTPNISLVLQDKEEYSIEQDPEDEFIPEYEQVKTKFMELTVDVVGQEGANTLIDIISNLEKVRHIEELTRELAR